LTVIRIASAAVLSLALVLSAVALEAANKSNHQSDVLKTSAGEVRLTPLYHGSVMLEFKNLVIHVDPWSQGDYTGIPPADLIVVTHTHLDHLDRAMIDRLHKPATVIVSSAAGADTLNCSPGCGSIEVVNNGEKKRVLGIDIEGVPMYNLVQGPEPGKVFHHKGVGSGYILTFGDKRVYVSGDTECVPEMKALKNIAVAFVAMNPPKTMTTAEAAACVQAFRPTIVYPYHYRGSNVQEFAEALKGTPIEVRVRKLEGEP
jgi:L-ascorbate metabolism protein UlaG (beta-lactamase superfamily)